MLTTFTSPVTKVCTCEKSNFSLNKKMFSLKKKQGKLFAAKKAMSNKNRQFV